MSGSANTQDLDLILDVLIGCAEVEKVINLKAIEVGPGELLVAAKIALPAEKTVREVAEDIAEITRQIRESVPAARSVYIQPDIYRPSLDPEPSTDVFVLKSAD